MIEYVVDSNFFIQAHRSTYPLDIALSFWDIVKQLAERGDIVSIDKVKNELYNNNDDLKYWCANNLPDSFFKNSALNMSEYARVSRWAVSMNHHYLPKALNEFLDANEADAFLVAYTLADMSGRRIVTQEISNPQQRNKIKIPEVCNAHQVQYMNTIEMFRELKVTF